jgi:phosphatidylserine/phosphatidylglycerophosphate/cardiolipin synthase-like enzyme
VLPQHPDQDGRISKPPNLIGRRQALRMLSQAGGNRVAVYGLENHAGVPVYVHAKVCVVDDTWGSVGSDNFNRRSWSHDSELSCAVIDERPNDVDTSGSSATAPNPSYAGQLRLALAREHLDRADGDDADLRDPRAAFDAFAATAAAVDNWYANGQQAPRPPGRLRNYPTPHIPALTRAWATPLYRIVFDPDGRPRPMRRAGRF